MMDGCNVITTWIMCKWGIKVINLHLTAYFHILWNIKTVRGKQEIFCWHEIDSFGKSIPSDCTRASRNIPRIHNFDFLDTQILFFLNFFSRTCRQIQTFTCRRSAEQSLSRGTSNVGGWWRHRFWVLSNHRTVQQVRRRSSMLQQRCCCNIVPFRVTNSFSVDENLFQISFANHNLII